jgi:hypothetical protein
MKTSPVDFLKSATSVFARWAVAAAITMLALTGNGMAQFVFPGTGYGYDNTKPIAGRPCHNKYHEVRQSLYEQQNILGDEMKGTGPMRRGVPPSPEQCEKLREIEASQPLLRSPESRGRAQGSSLAAIGNRCGARIEGSNPSAISMARLPRANPISMATGDASRPVARDRRRRDHLRWRLEQPSPMRASVLYPAAKFSAPSQPPEKPARRSPATR